MLRMMRRNVMVDLGPAVAGWDSDIIVAPDDYTKVNLIGSIIAVGPKCRLFRATDLGKRVAVQAIQDGDRRFSPRQSLDLGLPAHWHVIAFEEKVLFAMEK